MFEFYPRIDRAHGHDGVAPKLRASQYVRFVHGAQSPRTVLRARISKRGDPLDLRRRIRFRVPGTLYTLFGGVPALAKIHSAGEFAHNLKIQIPETIGLMYFRSEEHTSELQSHLNLV